jgi:hypothetical protein
VDSPSEEDRAEQKTLQTYLEELHDSVEKPVDYLEAGRFVVENGGEMALVAGPNFRTQVLNTTANYNCAIVTIRANGFYT